MHMDLMGNATIAWSIVAILIIGALVAYFGNRQSFSSRGFDETAPAMAAAAVVTPKFGRFYGEDNPIVATKIRIMAQESKPHQPTSDEYLAGILKSKGHISQADINSHNNYNRKNANKIARFSNQKVVSEFRDYVSPYVGGTRAMRLSPVIAMDENRVPNKAQAPIKGLYAQ